MAGIARSGALASPCRNALRGGLPVAALFLTLTFSPSAASELDISEYRSAVNDLSGILSGSEVRRLEERIIRYRDTTGIEIGILAVKSLDGAALEDYAHDVYQKWGPGAKDRDNGVLLVVAWDDHLARIEVGYGLEASLTDLEAGRIVSRQSIMAERFREGDAYGGFESVVEGIQSAVAGDYDPPEERSGSQPPQAALLAFFTLMMFMMLMAAIARRRARRLGVWGRGFGGAGLGGFGALGGLGGFGRGMGGGRSSGGGFTFGGGSSGGGGASGGW